MIKKLLKQKYPIPEWALIFELNKGWKMNNVQSSGPKNFKIYLRNRGKCDYY